MRFENIELEIKRYMNHMSIESAVKKVKALHLNRLDDLVDEAAKRVLKND